MIGYYIIGGLVFLISAFVSNKLKSKFKKYSQIQLQNGLSGAQIAQKMLTDNGIHDVEVISVKGQLTDHYNPSNKTVNLSEGVYSMRNAAAAAVAAHEVGHAVQHARCLFMVRNAFKISTCSEHSFKIFPMGIDRRYRTSREYRFWKLYSIVGNHYVWYGNIICLYNTASRIRR